MTIVYECSNGKAVRDEFAKMGVELDNETPGSSPMSTNLERMRNNIKKLMRNDSEKTLYSNVARYLISTDKKGDDIDDSSEVSIDDLRAKSKQLSETIESELVEYMKKEVKSLNLTNIKEFNDIVKLDDVDVMQMKANVGYIISDINLNTTDFNVFIDNVAELFEKVWLVKCGIDDCYTERVVLVVDKRNDSNSVSNSSLPIHQEELINFLYAVYSNAEFVLSSNDNEYKKIVERSIKLINAVKLF